MKDWLVKQSKHEARYQRVHCLIIFYTIIKIQYACNYRDRDAVKMGHLAVITDRKGHFKTCHFKKSVKMVCLKRLRCYYTRGCIVVGRYRLLHFFSFFIKISSWSLSFLKSYSCLLLCKILLLAWFSICASAPNWLVIYHKCWSGQSPFLSVQTGRERC